MAGVNPLVAGLTAKGLDGTDAGHGLDELHDQPGRKQARVAKLRPGSVGEPKREERERNERNHQRNRAGRVEQHEGDPRENHEQNAANEVADAAVEQLAQGIHIAGLTSDDLARRVTFVKFHAQVLGVLEDSSAQGEQNILADDRRGLRVGRHQNRARQSRENVGADDDECRLPIAVIDDGGQGLIDAEGQQSRSGDLSESADDHDNHGPREATANGRQQRTEQRQRPVAKALCFALGEVRALFSLHSGDGHRSASSSRVSDRYSRSSSTARIDPVSVLTRSVSSSDDITKR